MFLLNEKPTVKLPSNSYCLKAWLYFITFQDLSAADFLDANPELQILLVKDDDEPVMDSAS